MTRGRVVLAINSAWNIANFRAGLVRAMQADGWEVVAMAPRDEHVARVEALGCRFVELPMRADGTNPFADLRLLDRFKRALRELAPDAFLGYTIKPNVYGSLAAQGLGIPVINNIAGLGTAFIRRSWLTAVARTLYRRALRRSHRVLFQNEDDRKYFVDTGLVAAERSARVPGSGVDLQAFRFADLPPVDGDHPLTFLFVGRLLRDKGVRELVAASRQLRAKGVHARFQLLGFVDSANRTAIGADEVAGWEAEGLVQYLGSTADVRPMLRAAHCVVLPSYREGVPRTLLEAAAMGRPLIASDAVGCRDAVDDGRNGYLARTADADDLARQCLRFAALSGEERAAMGRASREKVEREFDERIVIDTYLTLLRRLEGRQSTTQHLRA
jgi:glycosyltransferase involved in cell wall biosynthesis